MKAVKEIREEREDVVSFWVNKKVLNANDEIEVVEEKVDECTLIELENRIATHQKGILDLQEKIAQELEKIELAKALFIKNIDNTIAI